jgi:uncharacterized protein
MRGLLSFLVLALLAAPPTQAQVAETKITYPTADTGQSRAIPATLRIPKAEGKIPAVVVVHGTSGIDGRGAFHIQELNAAGIATLEVDYFAARGVRPGVGQRPRAHDMVGDTYGALLFLAQHPAVDAARIGLTGFSLGGVQALLAAPVATAERYAPRGTRFAAHVALYPVCWLYNPGGPFHGDLQGALTGAPVLVQAGGKDDYDRPDSCQTMIAGLPEENRRSVALKYYPDATHAWDTRNTEARTFHDPSAHQGKGGMFRMIPNRAAAEESRAVMVAFFRQAFGL